MPGDAECLGDRDGGGELAPGLLTASRRRAGSARSPRPWRRRTGRGPRSELVGRRATPAAALRPRRGRPRALSPSARKRARSTSSNPSRRTIPMRSSCPGTAGNEYSLQEIRRAGHRLTHRHGHRSPPSPRGARTSRGRPSGSAAGGCSTTASRAAISSSGRSTWSRLASASISTTSPSRRIAIGPPACRLRRDVPDRDSLRAAAEPPVGEEGRLLDEARSDDRRA